jgi:hypothetical protein
MDRVGLGQTSCVQVGDSLAHQKPSGPIILTYRGDVFKWMWIPCRTLDLTFATPASLSNISEWLRRTRSDRSIPRLPPFFPPHGLRPW